MDNIQYWKDKMLKKLSSFLSNYEFEVFSRINENSDHVNLNKSEITKQISIIRTGCLNLAKAIREAKELKVKKKSEKKA